VVDFFIVFLDPPGEIDPINIAWTSSGKLAIPVVV
jgi:hypothetical protein